MNDAFENDKSLMYITGKVAFVNDVPIYPISIYDISEIGYSMYIGLLHYICVDIDDLIDNSEGKYTDKDVYAFLLWHYQQKDDVVEINGVKESMFVRALKMICKTDRIAYLKPKQAFIINGGILNNDNFIDFVEIVKERNGLNGGKEKQDNPADAKTAALLAKKKKLDKRVQKAKGNSEGSNITLADLVSITAAGLHLPISEIMKYDMYQFNDQFNRLRIFEDYHVNIQALLAGADADSVKLQHWISKIDASDE